MGTSVKKRSRDGKGKGPKPPSLTGWDTTDEQEIERRRWKGQIEVTEFERLEPGLGDFGTFRVRSVSGRSYLVEIRNLERSENSCTCRDFEAAGLGTCKHVEGVLALLAKSGKRRSGRPQSATSPRIEVHVAGGAERELRIAVPDQGIPTALIKEAERRFHLHKSESSNETLARLKGLEAANPELLRVSRLVEKWTDERIAHRRRLERRSAFLKDVEAGRRSHDVLKFPLFPYQRAGMMHLAFRERALLADDMGLGKTFQALAACELLRLTEGVERALVVCPASLKTEWSEQIESASDLSFRAVYGIRKQRLEQYGNPEFFTITNYEQILADGDDIQQLLRPDIVILDEAQRIKNWRTKTANAVKQLRSRFAFVLTGTPIENRIDEIYSIVQFLDPNILGSLFRFNRQYYSLDDRGRPIGYRNLDQLKDRLGPVMLRRRKTDVEDDLPGRTVNNYFVGMTDEQFARYDDYSKLASRIAAQAKNRPLTEAEFKRLQLFLACMRMTCDTPYILDEKVRDCPKLDELERVLEDLLADPACKVLIFSEWVRMLTLVRERLDELGIDFAWHTGSVPQKHRRIEINRFKTDPDCRVFLSSESGGVGLNLQVANAVINIDQPWNPAKLEQRIARAWRKHQKRSVAVINLISEATIEHRMLGLIEQKRTMAEAVVDADSDITDMDLPSGRAAFLERLEEIMGMEPPKGKDPEPSDQALEQLRESFGNNLFAVELRRSDDGGEHLLAIVESGHADADAGSLPAPTQLPVEVITIESYETMLRLEAANLVKFTSQRVRMLHESDRPDPAEEEARLRMEQARSLLEAADRKHRMATLLLGGGFEQEAADGSRSAAELAVRSLAAASGIGDDGSDHPIPELCEELNASGCLPTEIQLKAMLLWSGNSQPDLTEHSGEDFDILGDAELLLAHVSQFLAERGPRGGGIRGN